MKNLLNLLVKTQYQYQGQKGKYIGEAAHELFFRDCFRYSLEITNSIETKRIRLLDRLYLRSLQTDCSIAKWYGEESDDFPYCLMSENNNVFLLTQLEYHYLEHLDFVNEAVSLDFQFLQSKGEINLYYNEGGTRNNIFKPNSSDIQNRDGFKSVPRTANDFNLIDLIGICLARY